MNKPYQVITRVNRTNSDEKNEFFQWCRQQFGETYSTWRPYLIYRGNGFYKKELAIRVATEEMATLVALRWS